MHGLLPNILPFSYLGLTAHIFYTSAYEIGFLGYDDDSDIVPTGNEILWQTAPPDINSTACHRINPRWANNVEYAFVRTKPDQEPIPRFIGFYGNNDRPQTGCIPFNLKVIIKWEPELGDQLQAADTLKRDLNRWAVLEPHTERTERLRDILATLEMDYADGHVAWRSGDDWRVDRDPIRLFGPNETEIEFRQRDIIDSDNESDYNYERDGDDGDGDGDENEEIIGDSLGSPRQSGSTEGSEIAAGPDDPLRNIQWPSSVLDASRDLLISQMQPMAGVFEVPDVTDLQLLNLGLEPPIDDILDLASTRSSVANHQAGLTGAMQLMRDLSGPDSDLETGQDFVGRNPLDELE